MLNFILNIPIKYFILTAWLLLSIIMLTLMSITDHLTGSGDDKVVPTNKNKEEKQNGIK